MNDFTNPGDTGSSVPLFVCNDWGEKAVFKHILVTVQAGILLSPESIGDKRMPA